MSGGGREWSDEEVMREMATLDPDPEARRIYEEEIELDEDSDEYQENKARLEAKRQERRQNSTVPQATGGPNVSHPVGALPLAQLDALGPEERRRAAKRRGCDWPTTEQARDQLRDTLFQVIRHEDDAVIDAPTSLGKSHTVATTRWGAREDLTGGQPVVHLCETRDARDEVVQQADEHGGEYFVLRARHEACAVAAGDHDPADDEDADDPEVVVTINGEPASKWIQTVCDGRGVPFSAAHHHLEKHNDQGHDELPCHEGGRFPDDCDAAAQWDRLRDDVTRVRCDVHEHTVADCPDCGTERLRCDEAGTRGHSVADCSDCTEHRVRCDHHDPDHRVDSCIDCYDEGGGWAQPLIIATHNFAYVPGLRTGTNLVFDEQPDFRQELSKPDSRQEISTARVRSAVGAYLREIDAPVSTWEAFIQLARHGGANSDAANERDALQGALGAEPDREWYFENPDAHTLAPALARAIFYAEPRGNGRRVGKETYEPPRLDTHANDDDAWNQTWVSVVLDKHNDVQTVRTVPDLSAARSVVGLDAHPALPVWQANTLPWIQRKRVLEPEERHLWRRYERGLRVVQLGEATRPLASGTYFDNRGVRAVVEQLRDAYGADFRTAITADSVEDRLEQIMSQEGVADPDLMHFGEEKSRNDYAGEAVGLVEGCIDPGDDYILDLLAELDCDAEPERVDPADRDDPESAHHDDCAGEGCHECLGTGLERAHDRGFTGADADTAAEILASVRENHTAQAAGRYARNPDDPTDTATVFVRTDAMPPGFADVQVPGAVWVYARKQEQVVEALRERTRPVTARALARETGVSKQHVHDTLDRLVEHGAVDAFERAGANGATLYADVGVPNTGVVDLAGDGEETVNSPVWDSSTCLLTVDRPGTAPPGRTDGFSASDPRTGGEWDWRAAANGGDRASHDRG